MNKSGGGYNESPLHIAVERCDVQMVELLLEYKADPNLHTRDDESSGLFSTFLPLETALTTNSVGLFEPDQLSICRLLLNNGANPALYTRNADYIIHQVVETGDLDLVKKVVRGIDDDRIDAVELLQLAEENDNDELLRYLRSHLDVKGLETDG